MKHRMTSLVKVDSKGRVTIPQPIREALGIESGMLVALIADVDKGEILLSPILSRSGRLYIFEIEFRDIAGALARIVSAFADAKADILASKCASIIRGSTAGCTIIVDFSQATSTPEEVARKLESMDIVNIVRFRRFEGA